MSHIPAPVGTPPESAANPFARAVDRRSFLRYTGATAVIGGLALAGCKKDEDTKPNTNATLTSFTPATAPAGTVVTITGTNLTGATGVSFGGVAATVFAVTNATTITATVPAGAVSGKVVVMTPNGTVTSTTDITIINVTLTNNDTGILNYAYALEQLEAAFYTEVVANHASLFTALELDTLKMIRDHEIIHREFFKAALGTSRLADLTLDYTANGNAAGAINLNDKMSILNAARLFEDTGVQAYNGAGPLITSPDYLVLAGKIVSVEARHAALLRDLIAPNSFAAKVQMGSVPAALTTTGLDMSKKPSAILAAVLPYVKERAQLVSQLP